MICVKKTQHIVKQNMKTYWGLITKDDLLSENILFETCLFLAQEK
jgi:hypothetical protein